MKLVKIFFDAYRSLLEKELELKEDCIGFVGSNESGKSNIILAVNILNEEKHLTVFDTPKMDKSKNPSLRFKFELNEGEIEKLNAVIKHWKDLKSLNSEEIKLPTFITYNVIFDKDKEEELRFFTIDDIKVKANSMFLRFEKKDIVECKVKIQSKYISIANAVIVSKDDLTKDSSIEDCNALESVIKQISDNEDIIASLKAEIKNLNESDELEKNPPNEITIQIDNILLDISKKEKTLGALKLIKDNLEKKIGEYNVYQELNRQASFIDEYQLKVAEKEIEKDSIAKKGTELQKNRPLTESVKRELVTLTKNLTTVTNEIAELNKKILKFKSLIEELNEPLAEKYVSDSSELQRHIIFLVTPHLREYLPKVVYWEHNNNYILKSETQFTDILNKKNLDEVSRPLANIFLLGLGIKSFDQLKVKVKEIQNDANERSRLAKTLNSKINDYIKKVWGDYDQEILISLEKEQIRIEFYDPKKEDASYYNMEERSQGCRAFLSFLLTIGAEAKHGVIKDTILLLDEPETHLHPSGARYMLKELIKISENRNLVLYATHSIFLIDRENLNRHIILKKEKERTIILPANIGRVGYLMQEEVLYKALDVNINNDFTSFKENNFVFEGDGDVALFDFFYDKILKDQTRPYKSDTTAIFQGGKCNDILKYFSYSPIRLKSKWFFILDKDEPANKLKIFLEDKYKDYINKDVFIFQYAKSSIDEGDIELEDLLPKQLLIETYYSTFKSLNVNIQSDMIEDKVCNVTSYTEMEKIVTKLVEVNLQAEFKGKFKEILNQLIRSQFKEIRNEEKFKELFPEYYLWVSGVIGKMKEDKNSAQMSKQIPSKTGVKS